MGDWNRTAGVVCDGTNNLPTHRNQNQLVVDIFVTPVGHADTILLNFVVQPSTVSVTESVV